MRRAAAVVCLVLVPSVAAADPPILVVERTWSPDLPYDPAPITAARWPSLPGPLPPAEPATPAAARVVELLGRIGETQLDSRYQHRTDVRERIGRYRWDCSGLVSWVIQESAPVAARSIGGDRTSARGLFRIIERAPAGSTRRGWERIAHIEDVRPGDVFVWRTPRGDPTPHTGHTGFVLERPRPVPGLRDAYAIRVADSIIGPHQEDTRTAATDRDGGLGFGVMVFLTDGAGRATHFGWQGTRTAAYGRSPVLFGRLHR
jgi:hypothetical protein